MIINALLAAANFGGGFQPPGGENATFVPTDLTSGEGVLATGQNIISFAVTFMTIFAGIIFLYQFIRGALAWISAGGDAKKIADGREMITQGVIGLVIIIASYAILGVISTVLGLDLLNPAQLLLRLVPAASGGVTPPAAAPATGGFI